MYKFVALLLVFVGCATCWQQAISVVGNAGYPSHVTDSDDVTHIAYCAQNVATKSGQISYVSVDPRGTPGTPMAINGAGNCQEAEIYADISSADHLYIVYSAINSNSYSDVLFTESLDGGNTWATAIVLPQGNYVVERHHPTLLQIDVDVIQVFYALKNTTMSYVTRKGGVWSSETKVPFWAADMMAPRIDFTQQNGDIYYHILLYNSSIALMYLQTTLSQFGWWKEQIIYVGDQDHSVSDYVLITDKNDNAGVYIAYSLSNMYPTTLVNSTDNGQTFSTPGSYLDGENGDFVYMAFAEGAQMGAEGGFAIAYDYGSRISYATMDIEWTEGNSPSVGVLESTHARLGYGSDITTATFLGFTSSRNPTIYFNMQSNQSP